MRIQSTARRVIAVATVSGAIAAATVTLNRTADTQCFMTWRRVRNDHRVVPGAGIGSQHEQA